MMHKESLRPNGDIGHVAILVIDMQADFVGPSAAIPCKGAEACIPHINKLLQAARSQGIPIIFTQEAHRSSGIDFGRELDYGEPKHCLEGSPGVRLIDLVTREPGDHLVIKRRYSAFFATDLEILLRGLRVDTLILTGVATDVCVRATAQDKNYGIIESAFMTSKASTREFEMDLSVEGDSMQYTMKTKLHIYGRDFLHTDINTLTRKK